MIEIQLQSAAPKSQPFTLRMEDNGKWGVWDRAGKGWHKQPTMEASEAANHLPQAACLKSS